MTEKKEQASAYLLQHICDKDRDYIKKTTEAFGISKSTAYTYINTMLSDNIIRKNENGGFPFSPVNTVNVFVFRCNEIKREDAVFEEKILPLLEHCGKGSIRIWTYAFCEILNNAIEHSDADTISVTVSFNKLYTEITVEDDGIGIFENIRRHYKAVKNEELSLKEAGDVLLAGKYTTVPAGHSGEGIFFTSHILDEFAVFSSGICFTRDVFKDDYQEYVRSSAGTTVVMKLSNHSEKSLIALFNRFSDVDDGFCKTQIPVAHLFPGLFPAARSQARRLGAMIENFKEAELDYSGIDELGQGFAHELYVVWQKQHPDILLKNENLSEDAAFMINHVQKTTGT